MTTPVPNPTYCISWSVKEKRYVGVCVEYPELSWFDEIPEVALAGIRCLVAEKRKDASLAKLYEIQHVIDDEFFEFKPVHGFTEMMAVLNENSKKRSW